MKRIRENIWTIAIVYTAAVFLLNNVFHTALGEFLQQLSYWALAFVLLSFLYRIIKLSIKQFIYDRKKKNGNDDSSNPHLHH